MARRRRRFQHCLWHRLRYCWLLLKEDERRAIRAVDPAWVPPRPALDAWARPLRDNDSGEDFLFMRRWMNAELNALLSRLNDPSCPRPRGWARVPPADDADDLVPEFPDSGLEEFKSPEFYEHTLAPLERRFTDAGYLCGATLGQLGSDIEFTIYKDVHLRWTAPSPVSYRPTMTPPGGIMERWDDPAYDYLGDTYASHVNPIFWRLNGWINDRVEDWRRAHGIVGDLAWRGRWVGPAEVADARDEGPAGAGAAAAEEGWRRIDQIISASGAAWFDGFFRPGTHAVLFPTSATLLGPEQPHG
jgi:hypothetical protein